MYVADRGAKLRSRRSRTILPAPEESMSSAYQYGVETAAQPAASANVSAPEELCSLFRTA